MIKRAGRLAVGCMVLAATVAVSQMSSSTPQQQQPKASSQRPAPAGTDRGQQVFEQNCSRCHQSPEGFPASISGTIARHMRVRAGLSDEDYKALRKFLNP